MDIQNKVGVITGGGSGIGRATARYLAKAGASIVIADLDEKMSAESVSLIEADGGRALFVKTDVTMENDARRMLETALDKFGRLDILHNNAGIGLGPPGYPAAPLERWRLVLDIDLQAVILGCWLAAPIMTRLGGGVIVNTSSMAGLYPHVQDPIYAAVKAGVVNFTYSLASWASERKIRVNCVCPGITDTPMVRRGIEAAAAAGMIMSWVPGKMIQPEEIADAIATLIRDDSLYGRALEVRPTGRRLVETPGAPRAKA
ncbi:MAG: SDR family NAD(P)-dependent oxidoreductase [Candidatus Binataceae bacterium]